MPGTIGEWSTQTLVKFIQDILRRNPPLFIPKQTIDTLTCTNLLVVADQIQLAGKDNSQTTVGPAGSAAALPANPTGYFKVLDASNTVRLVPYYSTS